jgi:hypothetical protein
MRREQQYLMLSTDNHQGLSGATLVEFVIAIPIFIFFVIGVLQYSQIMYRYVLFSDLLRQAARTAMIRGGACSTTVEGQLQLLLTQHGIPDALLSTPSCIRSTPPPLPPAAAPGPAPPPPLTRDTCTITARGTAPCLLCDLIRLGSGPSVTFEHIVIVPLEDKDRSCCIPPPNCP